MASLSSGDKVEALYNRHKTMADFPEKSVPKGTEGEVVSVHFVSMTVDVKFKPSGASETTHRKVPMKDLKRL